MKNIRFWFVIFTLCLALALCACGDGDTGKDTEVSENKISLAEGEEVIIADANGCSFTIVRSDTSDDIVTGATSDLAKAIRGITGEFPNLKTDFTGKTEWEILIGNTNRTASSEGAESLGEKDYRISFEGTKIVIVGGSDASTVEAVDYFIANYISDGALRLVYGSEYLYTYVAPRIMVGDNELSRYKIYADGAPEVLVTRVSDAVFAALGVKPAVTDTNEGLCIQLISNSELEECYYRAKVSSDGNILIESDTATGLYFAVSSFEDAIKGKNIPGETYELSLSDSGGYPKAFESFTEADTRYFLCDMNKDDLSFEIGEEMIFNISLFANGELASCARFDWTMKGDDGKSSSGTLPGNTGMMTLSTTLDCNGFVMVEVRAIGYDGNEIDKSVRFSGAAGVHPELITTTVPEPDDFDEYWAEAIEEMMAVEPEIIEMEEIDGQSGFKTYKMKIACAGNDKWTGETYVSGYLTYPASASGKSLKLRATFQGYGVNSPNPSYNDNYISFAVCGHSIEIGMDSTYYSALGSNELSGHGWSTAENADPKNVYFRYMLLRDLQALRFMKEYFGENGNGLWDGETITLSGASQGGFQVIALAALDKDIDVIDAGVPWLCDIGGYTDGKKIKSSFRPDFAVGLGYFDSANFASRITCRVNISAGLGDPLCPPAGVAAMYNALNCPKTLTFRQNGTHSYNPPYGDRFTFSGK